MRRATVLVVLMSMALIAGWVLQPSSAIGAHDTKKVCKTVTKKVHGKKKKVRVCHTVKVAHPPTATSTPRPTDTPVPTATPTATSTPKPPIVAIIDPASFAIPISEFGPGAQMQVSQVEPTSDADDPNKKIIILHYDSKSWASEGRVTGFYEQVLLPIMDSAGLTHYGVVLYHVSIFGTAAQAAAAWQAQRNGWLVVDANKGSCGGPLGDPGYSCADSNLLPSGNLIEGYVKRGRILTQVISYNSYDDFENYFFSVVDPTVTIGGHIAKLLDARASSTPGNTGLKRGYAITQSPSFNWWLMHSVRNEPLLTHTSIQSRALTHVEQMALSNAPGATVKRDIVFQISKGVPARIMYNPASFTANWTIRG